MLTNRESLELVEHLGTGGFAQTYRARVVDPELIEEWKTDEVAVKIPLSKQKERSIIKDIELVSSLHMQLTEIESRNIVKYLGFCTYDGKIVMAMQYIHGGNLRSIIGDKGRWKRIPIERTVEIMTGILKGLSVIHQNHVIHRDIKPENILMDGYVPKITDFGIGRILRADEQASTTVGTPVYMSPEMYYNRVTYNTDIWSAGVTFYEMLCSQYPFGIKHNESIGGIIDLVRNENVKVTFPDELSIPKGLQEIIAQAIEKNPEKRYKNAEDMLKDIMQYQSGENRNAEQELEAIKDLMYDSAKNEELEKDLQSIIDKYPKYSKAYLCLGEYYNKRGKYDRAIDAFSKGIVINPDNAMLNWGLAMAYNKKGDNISAVRYLKQALSIGLESNLERYAKILLKALEKGE